MISMRGRSSRRWLIERRRDQYYRLAKTEGYRSRSTFKLTEILRKKRFIKKGYKVVDLGAAPGGWLQAIHMLIEDTGVIIGVDVEPIRPLNFKNLKFILASVDNPQLPSIITAVARGKVDAVLSDVAPHITGIWELDHARQMSLARQSLLIAAKVLKDGGSLFVKLFQGPETQEYFDALKEMFTQVSYEKPRASRPSSSEVYVFATGFKSMNTL